MNSQDLYGLAEADTEETLPDYLEGNTTLHELENLEVVDQHQQVIAMLNYFYNSSQLNHKERKILFDFFHKKLEYPYPICTLLYSDTFEEDKDNGVILHVRRYIELNLPTWTMRLLKTAECLNKVPRFTWAKYYAK
ncbi:hypothetical protein OESDEN_10111 [Oesophagostomum dentatum]|uniref:Uncharacterized protein n=1 Tax=Oesophagostomum dentatum TaxID=61180 RepID=A0A0B1T1L7_OESDE|nr:hypothetical protein OESDEN_10111 [Oesophagostomum dentatum]